MFIPVRTDTPLRRTPYMNYALILAKNAYDDGEVRYRAALANLQTLTGTL